MNIKLLAEQHLEFLSLKGGCTGSSGPIHVKLTHCWKPRCRSSKLIIIMLSYRSGLPPLMVQALRPPSVASEKTSSQRDSAVRSVMKTSVSWRAASTKVRATQSHAKPVQRVVVHSAL